MRAGVLARGERPAAKEGRCADGCGDRCADEGGYDRRGFDDPDAACGGGAGSGTVAGGGGGTRLSPSSADSVISNTSIAFDI
jgi:hypothetical protein